MATTTTNYGFNIAEGSDTVNLLTQCYPNFTSLDGILYPIEQSGTTTATVTKVGTVHQIVRVNSNCNMLRFVATANYATGDTFTVDGASVTATSVSGEALPAGAFVINQSVLCILNGSVLTVLAGGKSDPSAAAVTYNNTGSGLTAANVQDAIDEIVSDIPTGFAATAITYDNTGSGMTATNVQDAIDEIAQSGGGSQHGIVELWVNPDVTSGMAANTQVTVTSDWLSQLDAIIITECPNTSAGDIYDACAWQEFEKNQFPLSGDHWITSALITTGTPYFGLCRRKVSNGSITGTTLTLTFGAGEWYNCVSGGAVQTNANVCVPYRILGLIHNA